MRISTKHASLIRDGIRRARAHALLMRRFATVENLDIIPMFMGVIVSDIPEHPLSGRAYARVMDAATARSKREAKAARRAAGLDSQVPTVKAEPTFRKIVDGFHE